MSFIKFEKFIINEKDKEPKVDSETGDMAQKVKEEPVDTSKGTIKNVNINGVEYKAVLSTWKSIISKQSAMGADVVGVISIPGEDNVYEIMTEEKKKNDEEQ